MPRKTTHVAFLEEVQEETHSNQQKNIVEYLLEEAKDSDNVRLPKCGKGVPDIEYVADTRGRKSVTAIGRYVNRTAPARVTDYPDSVQKVVDHYIAVRMLREEKVVFDILTGDDLLAAYRDSHGGGSCMTGKRHTVLMRFYAGNPDKVGLLVASVVDDNGEKSAIGRGLLWNTDSGQRVMDRVYTTGAYGWTSALYLRWCVENGVFTKTTMYGGTVRHNQSVYHPTKGTLPSDTEFLGITMQLGRFKAIPYMDTHGYGRPMNEKGTYDKHTPTQVQVCANHEKSPLKTGWQGVGGGEGGQWSQFRRCQWCNDGTTLDEIVNGMCLACQANMWTCPRCEEGHHADADKNMVLRQSGDEEWCNNCNNDATVLCICCDVAADDQDTPDTWICDEEHHICGDCKEQRKCHECEEYVFIDEYTVAVFDDYKNDRTKVRVIQVCSSECRDAVAERINDAV